MRKRKLFSPQLAQSQSPGRTSWTVVRIAVQARGTSSVTADEEAEAEQHWNDEHAPPPRVRLNPEVDVVVAENSLVDVVALAMEQQLMRETEADTDAVNAAGFNKREERQERNCIILFFLLFC